jgi:hypothetical protein
MANNTPSYRALITAAVLGSAMTATPAEVRVEGEGFPFRITSIGEWPPVSMGADVDNSLHLEGLAPSLSFGVALGPSRSVGLRWRRLRDEHVYRTANPDLVLEGEQHVGWNSLDALFLQRLGRAPLRLEVGYRHLDLDRSWRDAVGPWQGGLATLDYSSQIQAQGVRGAIGLDVRFARRLHLEGTLGLGVMRAQESLTSVRTEDGAPAPSGPGRSFDGTRTLTMLDSSIRLRADVTSRFFLAVGYRYDSWEKGGDVPGEFDAHGPTCAAGFRLGGHR